MIEIVISDRLDAQLPDDISIWSCWLEISQGAEAYMLPTTAPGALTEAELQAYFDAREPKLWAVAQSKQHPVDLWENIPLKRLLKAQALVILDEVNILRGVAGLSPRTPQQIVTAIKAKL